MARPKILVFQHVPYEPLGTLDPLLKEAGFRIRYINFGRDPAQRPRIDDYEALIVLGGPMSADQSDEHANLLTEQDVIREAVQAGKSVLGICLGAQLLAVALGGRVARGRHREIGWHSVELTDAGRADPVLESFVSRQDVFQWHDDGIVLPHDAVHLARSTASDVQAFRYGEHAYGFQFHLEVDRALVERWLTVPENQAVFESGPQSANRDTVRSQTNASIDALQALSNSTFTRWIERFELQPRKFALPSR